MSHHCTTASDSTQEASSALLTLVRIARTHPDPAARAEVARAMESVWPICPGLLARELQHLTLDMDAGVRQISLWVADRLSSSETA